MCMYTVLYVDIRSYVLTIIPVSACRKQLNAGLVSWQLHSHSARLIGSIHTWLNQLPATGRMCLK